MKRNLLLVLLAIILVGSLALVACDQTDNDGWGTVFTYETAYAEAQELGYTGTLQDFIDSIKGKDGENGIDGKDGVGIKSVLVNEQGKLVVTLTNDIVIDCGTVQGPQGETGPQGPQGNPGKDGEDGADGITPQLKIGEDNYWYISYDNGATWASLGVKATGADGEQGPAGENGINGTTPQLRIGEDSYWYVSYDNGTTWTSLGVKATGSNGAQGAPGKGIASILKTNTDGFVDTYTITYTDGTTTTFTVTNGKDGQNGEQGIQGIQGVPGIDGHTPVITIQGGYWYIDGVNTNVLAEGIKGEPGNGISSIEKTASEGLVDTYTITFTDGSTTTFTVTNGKDGEQGIQGVPGVDGHTPVITIQNGYWYIDGVNTNVLAEGIKGETGNGISSIEKTSTEGLVDTYTITYTDGATTTFTVTNGKDGQDGAQGIQGIQGVPGKDGHTPVITIQNGYWYIDGVNTNVLAEGIKGETGNGISSIEKTSSEGLVDTYTITFTDGSTTTFTVTNGKDGQDGAQGIQGIQGVPGIDGHTPVITIQNGYWYIDGVTTNVLAEGIKGETGNGIASIEKTSTEGLVDTYTITFTDGTTTTFTVTNGKDGQDGAQGIQGIQGVPGVDGHTPVITIQDGYWYIDGVNTNVLAEGIKGETGNGIASIEKTNTVGLVDTYTITFTDGTTTTFTVTNGKDGQDGQDGAQGIQGIQGVPGKDGHTPVITIQGGYWYIDDVNTYVLAEGIKGEAGNGISSIDKTSSEGLVDTYTITFSNGTTTTFTVTNGKDGQDGAQGIQGIQGVPGVDGHTPVITIQDGYWYIDGINTNVLAEGIKGEIGNGISSIEKTSSEGLLDTYTITFTNGTTTTFTVTNGKDGQDGAQGIQGIQGEPGKDGHTPVITIQDGYWYIDGVNTNVKAESVQGPQGISIVSTNFDKNGNMVITYSDGSVQIVEHNWEKLYTLIEPGCLTKGKELYSCVDCTLVRVVTVDPIGHGYEETVVESTCTAQGYTLHTCSVCGDNYKDNYVETNGMHDFQEADTCVYCAENIENVAVETYNMSATAEDNVRGYVVPRADGMYDAYIKGTGAMKDYTPNSPFHVDGYSIKNAYIGNSVTSIGGYAFYYCHECTSITIPDSVTSIGSHAFYNCSSLTSITIPNSVTSIGEDAFRNCSSLTSITIPDGVTSIGSSAFRGCSSLTSVAIGNSVTSIGSSAFYNCSSLTSITIPNSVTSIGELAFCNAEYYNNSDNWQNKVLYIDNCLIEAKTTIEECVVKDGTTIIANNAFSGCNSLTSITIPDSVTSIGDYAFYNCSSLTNIAIPDSVTSIGSSAFSGCSSLTNITIPFVGATLNGTSNTHFGYIFGASSYSDNDDYVPSSLKSVVITGGSSIGSSAFRGCSSLTSITIPDSVTSIGSSAFSGCSSLTNIAIPSSVNSIGDQVFYDCSSLTNITIPDSVTSIGICAFQGCKGLLSITIPESVTSIGSYAFSGCSSLTGVYITDIAVWCNISFGNEPANPLYFAKNLYLNNQLVTELVIPDSITSIGDNTFNNCSNLVSITIPNTVTSIGGGAFNNCSSLTSIIIPDSVTSIGNYAFYGCSSLTSITIPDSVTSIGKNAFGGCSNLTSITLPFIGSTRNDISNSYLGYIFGASRYYDNNDNVPSSLKSVLITGGESIASGAFYNCSSLTNITIPDSVTSLGSSAFYNCSSLSSVTFERNCWYVTPTEGATSGKFLDLSDALQNSTYLNSTYKNYYWYASEHSYTAVVVAPTCTEKGYTSHTCDHCGDNYVDAEIKALGHDYIAVKTPQTETTPAFTTFTCETCGYSYSVEEDDGISPVENVAILAEYGFYHNETLNTYYEHEGLDFAAEVGTEVYAIFSGTVNNIYKDDILHGTEVIISCDNGYTLVYRFVEEAPGLEVGQTVAKGQVIATVAEASGNEYKSGSHLHFEIHDADGKTIDPMYIIDFNLVR